ncbi:hydrolase, alpha/beta fold family, putative [Synechococcus sp. PCC 7335]|uniref:alpha/beta fold hydrolase n=1 Tax=Synechococcus sp. (strain ATCC 29403 / PCC 7335) TaxID=91464 RepID=UPI00017EE825|nr:alpha/beta fold hydrolase [Synechococcus sp. PCC 7335]EDX83166.1 hydrolase, alpha/beta fold family, putative [Synechococcus sp. PCC 7335]
MIFNPMALNIEENSVGIDNTHMDYVAFGRGQQPFVILPGLSDGLKTVKGQAVALAFYCRQFTKDFRVYVFSRKNELEESYSTRDMARDQNAALERLEIEKAYVMGVSQGGMIAQHLAIDFPHSVEKLAIAVSIARQNEIIQRVVKSWINLAKAGDYRSLVIDTMEKTFTDKHLRLYRPLYPVISRIGKPPSFTRFLIQASACLTHDAYQELGTIQCPTLVIGGDCDRVAGKGTSQEIAASIKHSQLVLYKGLGHGAYEEAKDFNQQVKEFLRS